MSSAMYYIAIVTPADINKQVQKWKQYMKDNYGCAVALKSPAHITLIPPFWNKTEFEKDLKEFIRSYASGSKSFPLRLNNFGSFKPRVIFIQVDESDDLSNLKTGLEISLSQHRLPIKKDDRPYHPHMTIANRDLLKKDFAEAWEHFQHLSYDATFKADGISLLKHNGSNWDIIYTAAFPPA